MTKSYLRAVAKTFDENAPLAVRRGNCGIFMDVRGIGRDLWLDELLGAEVHFYATTAGKAMLVQLGGAINPMRRSARPISALRINQRQTFARRRFAAPSTALTTIRRFGRRWLTTCAGRSASWSKNAKSKLTWARPPSCAPHRDQPA